MMLAALIAVVLALCARGTVASSAEDESDLSHLPVPFTLFEAIEHAASSRSEIRASHARLAAAEERPRMAGALDDPMIMAGIDHYPYRMPGAGVSANGGMGSAMDDGSRYDWSVQVEQAFPMSRLRHHRRRAAEAGVDVDRFALDETRAQVGLEVAQAFFMLYEAEAMVVVRDNQVMTASRLVEIAERRLASALGGQSELMRAEAEHARQLAERDVAQARVNGAKAMFNAALGRPVHLPVPPLVTPDLEVAIPTAQQAVQRAVGSRPELSRMQAEVRRAGAEVDVMRSMGAPMGFVRVGEARTMAEGRGWMAMVGVSVPLARGRVRAGVSEAVAMQAMAEAETDAMRRMVEAEAIVAREAVAAARGLALAYRDEVMPRSRRAVESAMQAYAAGSGSLVDVLEATQAQWRTEEAQVMALSAWGQAWAELRRAVGGEGL
ncbi:MAG: TolC family protein [Lysobacteraceae bacterium]